MEDAARRQTPRGKGGGWKWTQQFSPERAQEVKEHMQSLPRPRKKPKQVREKRP